MCYRQQRLNKGPKIKFRLTRKDFTKVERKRWPWKEKQRRMKKAFEGNSCTRVAQRSERMLQRDNEKLAPQEKNVYVEGVFSIAE